MYGVSNCDFCNKEYRLKKEKAKHKFCSDSCRKKWHRRNKGEPLIPDFSAMTDNKSNSEKNQAKAVEHNQENNWLDNIDFSQFGLANSTNPIQKEIEPVPQLSENELLLNQWIDYRNQLEHQLQLEPIQIPTRGVGYFFAGLAGIVSLDIKEWNGFQRLLLMGGSFFATKKIGDYMNKVDVVNTNDLKQQAIQELPNANQQIQQLEIVVMKERVIKETKTKRRIIIEEETTETETTERTISAIKIGDGYKLADALDLINMKSEKYELDDKWATLFGYFPKNKFSAMIHGKRKNGKTHFCLQLAQYLQGKFLNVLYLSGEEGAEETFKVKLKRYNCRFKVLFDINGIYGIKNSIQDVQPTFVFIDSLTRLKLDVNDIIDLKELYPEICFFYILHATKAGDYKGGSSIEHEVSSIVEVKKGIAYQEGRMIDGDTKIAVFDDVDLE